MASSKITRKTLTPGGTEPKKTAMKFTQKATPLKTAAKSIAKSANTANKLVKSAAKAGVSVAASGAGMTVSGTSKAVGNLAKKAASTAKKGIAGSPRVGGGKLVKKATSPRGAGAITPSTTAKTSSKISRKYY